MTGDEQASPAQEINSFLGQQAGHHIVLEIDPQNKSTGMGATRM